MTSQSATGPKLFNATVEFDLPRLLVDWEPRWHAFCSAIGPALSRSARPLAGEVPAGIEAGRGGAASLLIHVGLIAVLFSISAQIVKDHVLLKPRFSTEDHQVLYFSGPLLPQMKMPGASAGTEARSGGREAFHPTQTIRVARGDHAAEQVADLSKIKLPKKQ